VASCYKEDKPHSQASEKRLNPYQLHQAGYGDKASGYQVQKKSTALKESKYKLPD